MIFPEIFTERRKRKGQRVASLPDPFRQFPARRLSLRQLTLNAAL